MTGLPPGLLKVLSWGETVAFLGAAVLGAVAEGKIDSPLGHIAVIAGAVGAALHGFIHNPPESTA